ncbi:MAG: amidohydrolase family protein [Phycisphaeraceae bacterium]
MSETAAPRSKSAAATAQNQPRPLTLIDCDVHQTWRDASELTPYLDPYFAQVGVRMPGSPYFSPIGVARRDAAPDEGGPAGSSLQTMQRQHLDPFGVDYAILTGGGILGLGTTPDFDYAAALARAYNDWLIDHWLDKDDRLFGSLVIAPQDGAEAAREIRRVGHHPRIVQVLMCSAAPVAYGRPQYHPIYEAAAELGLPVAIHPGTEGRGIAGAPTNVGWPRNYLEWHTNLSQGYQAHVISLVLEGVFEKFPSLRFVCLEGGLAWLPHVMWRMDKNWKALRTQAPWLKRLPSEYIVEHIRLTTQPIEEPPRSEQLLQLFDMMRADRTVMFSSDYPHWDYDSPTHGLPKLPDDLRERIMWRNAAELYGLLDDSSTPGHQDARTPEE